MKSQLHLLAFIILSFCITDCHAQLLEVNSWNTFDGSIGSNSSHLSLYLFEDSTIKGNYVLKDNGKKISVTGHLKPNALFLAEVKNEKSSFKGNISTIHDRFEGTRTDSQKKETIPFTFQLSSITGGSYDQRYSDIYGTDDEVEAFMKKVKNAILTDNKQWVADHVQYPLRHVLSKKYPPINNKKLLMKYYDQIFSKQFKGKIKHAVTTNLFNKDSAAMLANGEIWIGNTTKSTEDKYSLIIVAINP
jgi:hypothetical protein